MKNIIKKFIIQLYYSIRYYIPNLFVDLYRIIKKEPTITVIAFLDTSWGKWRKQNWGDDMNVYFAKEILQKEITCYNTSILSWLLNKTNYSLIGSILQSANKNTIVWGSGLISDKLTPIRAPRKIYAVRGPLTRDKLIEKGYNCPAVFGDPILLLPYFYKPRKKKSYKIGIIPNLCDEGSQLLINLSQNNNSCHLISMTHYKRWKDVVDEIISCESIISSSLHGIIISDAYGIPNLWAEFSDKVIGDGFKFRDYFASVNRKESKPFKIKNQKDFYQAEKTTKTYNGIQIDLKPLMDSCPFNIKRDKIL